VSEVRSFLGLAGYYRRFIEGFSKIARSMIELLRKDKKFTWTESCEKSFQELKKRLTTAPVLTTVARWGGLPLQPVGLSAPPAHVGLKT